MEMSELLYKDIELVKLDKFFTPAKFRTVCDEGMLSEGGVTEIKVITELRDKSAKKLNFKYSNMMVIYGFAIMNDCLRQMNKDKYASYYGNGIIKRVVMSDCGEVFTVTFEYVEGKPEIYKVDSEEVIELLNECMHALPQ